MDTFGKKGLSRVSWLLIPLLLVTWACGGDSVTPTPLPTNTIRPTPTLAVESVPTVVPTSTETAIAAAPTTVAEVTLTSQSPSNSTIGALNCPIDGPNLLVNPSFEAPFNQIGQKEINVAHGWQPWFVNAGDNFTPEYKPADPQFAGRVIDGLTAQVYFKSYGRFIAGVRQTVMEVESGARYQFSVYGHAWSCEEFDNCPGGTSYNPANMNMRVGIDPTGGLDARGQTVIYSDFVSVLDTYAIFCIDAFAESDSITVFTYAAPDGPRENQDLYWDNAALRKAP